MRTWSNLVYDYLLNNLSRINDYLKKNMIFTAIKIK